MNKKIETLDDLFRMKQHLESQMSIREKSNNPSVLVQIRVALGTCGIAAGARDVMNLIIEKAESEKLPVLVTQCGCMGFCDSEPTVEVEKPGEEPVVFGNVDKVRAVEIIDRYVKEGLPVDGVIPVSNRKLTE